MGGSGWTEGFYWIGVLKSIALPVAVAASLPLSYRNPKPFKVLWAIGFVLAILGTIGVAVGIGALSALTGASGKQSDVVNAFAVLSRYMGLPTFLMFVSPFIVAWALHAYRHVWAGKIRPIALEAIVVALVLSILPIAASHSMFANVQHMKEQRAADIKSSLSK